MVDVTIIRSSSQSREYSKHQLQHLRVLRKVCSFGLIVFACLWLGPMRPANDVYLQTSKGHPSTGKRRRSTPRVYLREAFDSPQLVNQSRVSSRTRRVHLNQEDLVPETQRDTSQSKTRAPKTGHGVNLIDEIASIAATRAKISESETPKLKRKRRSKKKQKFRVNEDPPEDIKLGSLECTKFGGPDHADEMIYWRDIPQDREWTSPFKRDKISRYLSVEVDEGGWNNIRMTVEIAMAMAHATGRTFILPPRQGMYLLEHSYTLHDFYNLDGLDVIEMKDFLETEVATGRIRGKDGSHVSPPQNRTDWTVDSKNGARELDYFLRTLGVSPEFRPLERAIFIPSEPVQQDRLEKWAKYGLQLRNEDLNERRQEYFNHPTPVNASAKERFREQFGDRDGLWLYDDKLANVPLIHFKAEDKEIVRMHGHFYFALFFQDWKMELLIKRYVRDRLRYRDDLFCAAGRIVNAMRRLSLRHDEDNGGIFHTFHVRRNDFAWIGLVNNSQQIIESVEKEVPPGSTVYIATDEKNKDWFHAMMKQYHVYFLADFGGLLSGVDKNHYGIVDQIVVARGAVFVGAFYSTVTSHANHLRGYYSQREKTDGYELGVLDSYHYAPQHSKNLYRDYVPFGTQPENSVAPTGWRFIDKGIE